MLTRVCFKLPSKYADGAQQVLLVGEFNDWKIEKGIHLDRTDDGTMIAELNLLGGRTYQYRYYLGDGRWVNDDSNKTSTMAYGMNVENCLVEVPKPVSSAKENKTQSQPKARKSKSARSKSINDDFTAILGINSTIAKVLQHEGMHTYADLSKCTMKKLLLILHEHQLMRKARHLTSWTRQAKLAAASNHEAWDAIKKLLAAEV